MQVKRFEPGMECAVYLTGVKSERAGRAYIGGDRIGFTQVSTDFLPQGQRHDYECVTTVRQGGVR